MELRKLVTEWEAPSADCSIDASEESCGRVLCGLHCLQHASFNNTEVSFFIVRGTN